MRGRLLQTILRRYSFVHFSPLNNRFATLSKSTTSSFASLSSYSTPTLENPSPPQPYCRIISAQIHDAKLHKNQDNILKIYTSSQQHFTHFNYAHIFTALSNSNDPSNLRKLRDDSRFVAILNFTIEKVTLVPTGSGCEFFTVRELLNIAHSLGKLEIKNYLFFKGVERQHLRVAQQGTPQELAMLLWACVNVGFRSPQLFESISDQYSRIVREGDTQSYAMIARAYAKNNIKADMLFHEISTKAETIAREGTVQGLSNICWSFARNGHYSDALFSEIAGERERIAREGSCQALALTLWAFATCGCFDRALFVEIANCSGNRLVKRGNAQAVSNTLWAFAIAGFWVEGSELIDQLWDRVLTETRENENINIKSDSYATHMKQLYHCYAAANVECNLFSRNECNVPRKIANLPSELLERMVEPFSQLTITTSRSQLEVSRKLEELNFDHELEVSPFAITKKSDEESNTFKGQDSIDKFLTIDIASVDEKIAIEYNGPQHYLRKMIRKNNSNGSGKGRWKNKDRGRRNTKDDFYVKLIESGRTKFKRRLLERLGWKVLIVRFNHWSYAFNMKAERAFLVNMFNEKLNR